jgi:hypothetical protein
MYGAYMQVKVYRAIAIIVSTVVIHGMVFQQTNPLKQIQILSKSQSPKSILTIERQKLDVNNISAWFRNDGEFYSDHSVTGPGFEWPKGIGKFAVFSAGFWMGARYKDSDTTKSIRVTTVGHFGSEYRPGVIDKTTGLPDDYTKPEYKIYKVRPLLDNANSNPDYLNWPVNQGAPWIDINNDGKWDPFVDKPGIQFHNGPTFPDMMLYYVYNDADSTYHTWIWGRSKPLGVEVHKTAWAYNALPNVHFLRFQIYNKSQKPWDGTYIGLWSDPDDGDPFDDFAGCDIGLDSRGKRHDLGYAYNGNDADGPPGYGDKPPSVGFKLMQGPIIISSNSDTATSFGIKVPGYKNLGLSAYNVYCNPGQGGCTLDWIDPGNYLQTYNFLQGLNAMGKPWINRSGDTTTFVFDGDPVTGIGWLNQDEWGPSDIRSLMVTGPFTLAPSDSQDIIYASLIEQGTDRLNSITKLRKTSSDLRYIFDKGLGNILSSLTFSSKFISPDSTVISIKSNSPEAQTISAKLYRENYESSFELLDDGLHNDGGSNDGVFGNAVTIPPNPELTKLSLTVSYKDGQTIIFDEAGSITTSGPVEVENYKIISDNINADGEANPGENIRCTFGLKNYARDTLSNFNISIYPIDNQIVTPRVPVKTSILEKLGSNNSGFLDSSKYIIFDMSSNAIVGTDAKFGFEISDSKNNVWYDTVAIEIKKLLFTSKELSSQLTAGESEGNFGIRIIDPSQIKNNIYRIAINKFDSLTKVFNLLNTSVVDTLLNNHPLPDEFGHNVPVTDGFRITRGTTTTNKGLKNWSYSPSSNVWFNGVRGWTTDLYKPSTGYGLVAYPTANNFIYKQTALPIDSLRYVQIEFSKTNTQKAYRYLDGFYAFPPTLRRVMFPEFRPFIIDSVAGSGFVYQDYQRYRLGKPDSGYVVPFTVWEVNAKGNKIRQLDIGIVERNDSLYRWIKTSLTDSLKEYLYYGNIDGRWNPSPERKVEGTALSGRRGDEVLLIFGTTYTDSVKVRYISTGLKPHFNLLDSFPRIPVMYAVTMRKLDTSSTFKEGDVFKINPYYPLKEGDVYSFNPVELKEQIVPSNYRITQNYPNPFNAGTNIQYGLPFTGRVTLEIYNILGQRVATLINNEERPEGNYTIYWDGTTINGKLAASGVYLYRINITGSQGSFAQTKKMVVIK